MLVDARTRAGDGLAEVEPAPSACSQLAAVLTRMAVCKGIAEALARQEATAAAAQLARAMAPGDEASAELGCGYALPTMRLGERQACGSVADDAP